MAGVTASASRRGGITGINVTPMVDIVLVLLIIMMVSATYIVSQSLKVELPKTASSDETVSKTYVVTITKDGQYLFNDKATISKQNREGFMGRTAGFDFVENTLWPAHARSNANGAYLVNGPGHCGECHTPRNALGAREHDRFLAGTRDGPDGKPVPNITPHEDGLGGWSKSDIAFALQTGILPDGDVLGGAMSEVVDDATSHLTADDRNAIAEYLLSVPPLPSAPAPAAAEEG